MINRDDVLSQACDECIKELYSFVQPSVKWEDFIKECEIYTKCYKEWDTYNHAYHNREENPEKWEKLRKLYEKLDWENKSINECIGPRPYEFYYLPKEIMKDICESYIHAYKIDQQQELLDTIEVLKNYCKEPIVDKWIERNGDEPGYRGYDHPDNLEKEINTYLDLKFPLMDPERAEDAEDFENKLNIAAKELQTKFFEFLDMAGNFYNWNRDLNAFNTTVYLGPSPNPNKEVVIDNWKKYRMQEIEIDEEQIKKEYYGEELD
jgi:hypothetical protein